ncbi:hypothetical protein [Bradyrhizobium cenepequi]|nr:hypothetical protein [Bradyrhizobium cenepequi]MCA6111659.1 hypothetical protein [Bradyrhizobium cenepequi]
MFGNLRISSKLMIMVGVSVLGIVTVAFVGLQTAMLRSKVDGFLANIRAA